MALSSYTDMDLVGTRPHVVTVAVTISAHVHLEYTEPLDLIGRVVLGAYPGDGLGSDSEHPCQPFEGHPRQPLGDDLLIPQGVLAGPAHRPPLAGLVVAALELADLHSRVLALAADLGSREP